MTILFDFDEFTFDESTSKVKITEIVVIDPENF